MSIPCKMRPVGTSVILPAGYKRVDYLESPSKASNNVPSAFRIPLFYRAGIDEISIQTTHYFPERNIIMQIEGSSQDGAAFNLVAESSGQFYIGYDGVPPNVSLENNSPRFNLPFGEWITWELTITKTSIGFYCNGQRKFFSEKSFGGITEGVQVYCFGRLSDSQYYGNYGMWGRKKSYTIIRNGKKACDLVPCLDPTGAPCMFDLVSRTAFYNVGTGDFTYPTESTTYSLRRVLPDWGKLTEHGLRRLYHAPAGWQGELYDYALENGFKPIVEPEKPEKGYWVPRWTETEEEIVLEWVETGPPPELPTEPSEEL